MTYGYCRISTPKQSLTRQIQNICAEYPAAKIITETYTGTSIARPEWDKLKAKLKSGDTVVFDSVSRMSRNADEGIKEYMDLYQSEVNLIFLKEPHINSDVYRNGIQHQIEVSVNTGRKVIDSWLQDQIELMNRLIIGLAQEQIRLAFEQSEKEVADLHRRTAEGMAASGAGEKISEARTGKCYTTKKEIQCKEIILKHSKSYGGSLTDTEIIQLCGCSRNSYYKYKKALQQQENAS